MGELHTNFSTTTPELIAYFPTNLSLPFLLFVFLVKMPCTADSFAAKSCLLLCVAVLTTYNAGTYTLSYLWFESAPLCSLCSRYTSFIWHRPFGDFTKGEGGTSGIEIATHRHVYFVSPNPEKTTTTTPTNPRRFFFHKKTTKKIHTNSRQKLINFIDPLC